MNRLQSLLIAAPAAALVACVTINVYFPAAAAQAAADKVIDEVWGGQVPVAPTAPSTPADVPAAPVSQRDSFGVVQVAGLALDFVIPVAQAEEPNLDASSPETQRLTDSMEARFADLAPFYASGAVGIGADGYIALHNPNVVPLPERNRVRTLMANENADRAALYREIAIANKHPEWEAQVRGVFAQRWIARAKAGWWVQQDGAWKQK